MTLERKRYLALVAAGLVGVLAIVPYQLALLAPPPGVPVAALVGAGILQGAILVGAATAAGGWLAPRAGLGTPILDAALGGQPIGARVRAIAPVAVRLGALAGVTIVVVSLLLAGATPVPSAPPVSPPIWAGALAALYGGITEELLTRYFLVSLFAWLALRVTRAPAAYWVAILAAALLFGAAHLPAAATVFELTPLLVARIVTLNAFAGVIFGWLYWRYGLEAAMLSHFAADLVLHVVARALPL